MITLAQDPMFDSLDAEPAFDALLKKIGVRSRSRADVVSQRSANLSRARSETRSRISAVGFSAL